VKKNRTELFIKIMKKLKFVGLFGYFIINNVRSNDTCIDYVFQKLKSILTPAERSHRRLYCYGHIFNLVV